MWCVRWYLRYPISVAQMREMTRERGLGISASCVFCSRAALALS